MTCDATVMRGILRYDLVVLMAIVRRALSSAHVVEAWHCAGACLFSLRSILMPLWRPFAKREICPHFCPISSALIGPKIDLFSFQVVEQVRRSRGIVPWTTRSFDGALTSYLPPSGITGAGDFEAPFDGFHFE